MCFIVPTFVLIGQTVEEIQLFFDFPRWQPSAILYLFLCVFVPQAHLWPVLCQNGKT